MYWRVPPLVHSLAGVLYTAYFCLFFYFYFYCSCFFISPHVLAGSPACAFIGGCSIYRLCMSLVYVTWLVDMFFERSSSMQHAISSTMSLQKCSNPSCVFVEHSSGDTKFEKHCCGRCRDREHWRGIPQHGKLCEKVVFEKDVNDASTQTSTNEVIRAPCCVVS